MRTPTHAEQIKINVYEALTAPDVVVTCAVDHWEIDIMREAPERFFSTDALMEAIQTNIDEAPDCVLEEVEEMLRDEYAGKFNKYWISNTWTDSESLDYESMTVSEMQEEHNLAETIDEINYLLWTREEERRM